MSSTGYWQLNIQNSCVSPNYHQTLGSDNYRRSCVRIIPICSTRYRCYAFLIIILLVGVVYFLFHLRLTFFWPCCQRPPSLSTLSSLNSLSSSWYLHELADHTNGIYSIWTSANWRRTDRTCLPGKHEPYFNISENHFTLATCPGRSVPLSGPHLCFLEYGMTRMDR